jgi:hypothetical protein
LSITDQSTACNDHLCLPGLFSFAEPINGESDYIIFESQNGYNNNKQWTHGKGGFSTKELIQLSTSQLTNPLVEKAKELGCEILKSDSTCDAIIECTRSIWEGTQKELYGEWGRRYNEDFDILVPIKSGKGINELKEYSYTEYKEGRFVIMWKEMKQIGSKNIEIRECIK